MPLHFIYGASPKRLSQWVARHSIDRGNTALSITDWLTTLSTAQLGNRTPIDWTETLHLLKRILGEDHPLPGLLDGLESVAHLLLRAKANLVFVHSYGDNHPSF